jgi:hypothetical protein
MAAAASLHSNSLTAEEHALTPAGPAANVTRLPALAVVQVVVICFVWELWLHGPPRDGQILKTLE